MKLLIIFLFVSLTAANWVKEMEDENLFQGDILLDPDEDERANNGFASIKGGRWPEAKIPYVVESSIRARGLRAIDAAIADYHKHTCLRFSKRTNQHAYISFYRGDGCSSPVGYRAGRKNRVSLASGCWGKGTVMHEIGHSIGLYHEQSRRDRDQYITIRWNMIVPPMEYNFNKASNTNSLGTTYDYRSMMHYGQKAFGNGWVTIQTKDPSMQNVIGNRSGFSEIDIKQINLMYCINGGNGGETGGGSEGGDCSDIQSDCQKHIKGCSQWGEPWKEFMKKKCRKTCGFC